MLYIQHRQAPNSDDPTYTPPLYTQQYPTSGLLLPGPMEPLLEYCGAFEFQLSGGYNQQERVSVA